MAAGSAARMTSHVPMEFIGKARQLRGRLALADTAAADAIGSILAPLQRRFARDRMTRTEALAGAARGWRVTVPGMGSLSRKIELTRRDLGVVEHRASAGLFRFLAWDGDDEPGVVVLAIGMVAGRGHLDFRTARLAVVGLHALARRYQRGHDRSEAAILADLTALIAPVPADGPAEFSIAVPGGHWIGQRTSVPGNPGGNARVRAVRTYLDADLRE